MNAKETYVKIREIISVRAKSQGAQDDDVGVLAHHAINYVMYLWAENWAEEREKEEMRSWGVTP